MELVKINQPPAVNMEQIQIYRHSVSDYAHEAFAHLSDSLLEKNFLEFAYIHDCRHMCRCCMALDMCDELINTSGYVPIPSIEPNGSLHISMTPCQYNKSGVYAKTRKKAVVLEFKRKDGAG